MKALYSVAVAFTTAVAALLLTLLALPWLLAGHQYQLRCVAAKFTTPAEQFEIAARAGQTNTPVFNALYDPLNNTMMDAYVPPRASFAYYLLSGVNHGRAIAAKEDFLPAPPAPMAFEFIDRDVATPFEVSECEACRRKWLVVFTGAGTASLGMAFLLRRRLMASAPCAPATR